MPIIPKSNPKKPWIAASAPFEGTTYTTFYSCAPWRRLRLAFIWENPLCKHCDAKGIITPASEVDHIQPINPNDPYDTKNGKYGKPLDRDNLQALCKACHTKKTAATKGIETR
jgi:5-methylcytosine-specific restriction endonuclease McrA